MLRVLHAAQEVAVPAGKSRRESAKHHRRDEDRADRLKQVSSARQSRRIRRGRSGNGVGGKHDRPHQAGQQTEDEADQVRRTRREEAADEVREQRLRREEVLEVKQRPLLDLCREEVECEGQHEPDGQQDERQPDQAARSEHVGQRPQVRTDIRPLEEHRPAPGRRYGYDFAAILWLLFSCDLGARLLARSSASFGTRCVLGACQSGLLWWLKAVQPS